MLGKSSTAAAAVLSLFASQADAYWRMSCPGTVFSGRVDPIVTPNGVASHTHIVLGGNGFAPDMDYASTQKSTCTSCSIKGDLSNYWTPMLYYRNKNGTVTSVPVAGGSGGTVYYQQRAYYGNNKTISAFPEGFRMLAGSPDNRLVDITNTTQEAVTFACLGGNVAEGQLLPKVPCPDGLRAQVYFPQCWDGKNLDSANHKDHMAYPDNYNGGNCPDSHPVPTMGLFYEFLYSTADFEWWTPSDADQPFVLSNGDTTGRGFHGDFVNGWDVAILQNGINKKTSLDAGCAGDVLCDGIFEYPDVYGKDCTLPQLVDEPIFGTLDKLPGCNKISATAPDTKDTSCTAPSTLAVQTQNVYTDVTSQGWKYLGCGNDTYGNNALPTKIADTKNMTVQTCVKQCGDAKYKYAGLEYSSQCFCGNDLPQRATPVVGINGECNMPCSGDSTQTCGAGSRLSLYQSCAGGDCTNAFVGFVGEIGSLANNAGSGNGTSASSGTKSSSGSSPSSAPSSAAASAPASSAKSAAATSAAATSVKAPKAAATSVAANNAAATSAAASAGPISTGSSSSSTSNTTLPSGWTAAGCYSDSLSSRALTGETFAWWGEKITTSNCAAHCAEKGFSLAGTEYGGQCFCGNELNSSTKQADSDCNMACDGDSTQMCGGSLRLSVISSKVMSRRAKALAMHKRGAHQH